MDVHALYREHFIGRITYSAK